MKEIVKKTISERAPLLLEPLRKDERVENEKLKEMV